MEHRDLQRSKSYCGISTQYINKYQLVTLILIGLLLAADPAIASPRQQINIGVLAYRGSEQSELMWKPTADYLNEQIPEIHFRIVPVSNDDVAMHILEKKIHLIIANPALYAQLEAEFGVSRIATLINYQLGKKFTQFGAVIFTHATRNDIFGMKDLVGKKFMAVHEEAFGGWWMALREFQRHNIDPHSDFSEIEFAGFPQDDVVRAVKQGKVDAGTVRTGVLEHMAASGEINLSEFKIINPKLTPDFPFAHSTPLYPEWALATTNNAPPLIAKKVVTALFNLEGNSVVAKSANSAGWTVPLDYLPVHKLMMELKVGPYQPRETNVIDAIVRKNAIASMTILAVLLITSILLIVKFRLLVNQRQAIIDQNKQTIFNLNNQVSLEQVYSRRIISILKTSNDHALSDRDKLQLILEKSCNYFGMDMAIINEVNTITKTFSIVEQYNKTKFSIASKSVFDMNNSLTGVCFNHDESLIIPDLSNSDLKNHSTMVERELKSYMGLMLTVQGKPFGSLEYLGLNMASGKNNTSSELLKVVALSIEYILGNLNRQYPGKSLAL